MPTTRAGATAAQTQGQLDDENVLEHVLQMIMGFPMDSEAAQALDDAGVKSVKDLLMLDGEMFAQLTFKAGADEKKLKFLDVAKLRKFFPFHLALCQRDIVFRVSNNDWYNIADNDWDEYCVSPAAFLVGSAPTPTTMVSTTTPTVKSATPITLRDNFAKSIKKDPEAYPAFKEARFWDTWNRELHSKAHLHDLSNVLDPTYLPTTVEENELFELQKRFMYSVFFVERIS